MKEINFAGEVKEACKIFECVYYKIPDSSMGQRFIPPKPFDAYIIKNSQYVGIEFKMHKVKTAYPFGAVKDHQIEGLMDIVKNGKAVGIVMLNIRMKGINETYWLHVAEYVVLKYKYVELQKRKSIPLDELRKAWHFIPRDSRNLQTNKICLTLEPLISSLCPAIPE